MLTRNQARREREMQKTHTDEFKTFTEIVKGYMCLFETMHNPGWHDKNKADIKVETVYVLFNYLMLEKTKKIISGPEYERFRKVMLNKVKQLKNEANTFANHHKLKYRLLSILTEAEEFLLGRSSQTNDSSESLCLSRSDRVKNKIVAEFDKKMCTLAPPKRIIVKVLPRRSARLMA